MAGLLCAAVVDFFVSFNQMLQPWGCWPDLPDSQHSPRRQAGTHTWAAACRLLHKKSASLRQDGAVQNYPLTSQKLLQRFVSTDFSYVQIYTPRLAGAMPAVPEPGPCCQEPRGHRGTKGRGLVAGAWPCPHRSSCHRPSRSTGRAAGLGSPRAKRVLWWPCRPHPAPARSSTALQDSVQELGGLTLVNKAKQQPGPGWGQPRPPQQAPCYPCWVQNPKSYIFTTP